MSVEFATKISIFIAFVVVDFFIIKTIVYASFFPHKWYSGRIKTQDQIAWRILAWIVPFSYLPIWVKHLINKVAKFRKLPVK